MIEKKALPHVMSICRRGFWLAGIFSAFLNMLVLTSPLYMMQVYDRVLTTRSVDTLLVVTMLAGFALAILAALEAVRGYILARIGNWMDHELMPFAFTGCLKAAANKVPSAQSLRDLSSLRTYISGSGVFPLFDAPFAVLFLAMMFLLHPLLGWVALGSGVYLFILGLINDVATKQASARSSNALMLLHNIADHSVRNSSVINAMAMKEQITARIAKVHNNALKEHLISSDRNHILASMAKGSRFFLQSLILGLGAWLVIQGQMSPGGIIAGSILMGRALAPVEQSIASWRAFTSARSTYARLKEAIGDQNFEAPPSMSLPRPEGRLELENVGYRAPQSHKPILHNITFKVEAGQAIGIIGPSASGKTTLARLICGAILPSFGHVRLEGADTASWDEKDRGQHIGYLPQDIELFHGTVKENISRFQEESDEAVIEAATLMGSDEMIRRLPQGYDTDISVASSLSAGQRQRIGITRAVFGSPRYIIFDEPNSNLDIAGEEALIRSIEALKEAGHTLIVIAHRPKILVPMDKILVLQEGQMRQFDDTRVIMEKFQPPQQPQQNTVQLNHA